MIETPSKLAADASPEEIEKYVSMVRQFRGDFPGYAAGILKIRTKSKGVRPFILNRLQRHLHAIAEEQRRTTGKVRILILKGRQGGMSTYVAGRFFWLTSMSKGLRTFILTHRQDATDNLFGMVTLFQKEAPPLFKLEAGVSNAKELAFDETESGYKVATAGAKAAGRSSTIQLFHGSEVAFWPNQLDHAAGSMQAVPNEAGTEIFLESTANGFDALFKSYWDDAIRGRNGFIPVFLPWFWTEEYRLPVPDDFALTSEEIEYKTANGLDMEQMVWRRSKIGELKSGWLFKQEYPANAIEAFQTSGVESYIPSELVIEARKRWRETPTVEMESGFSLILGVDPAISETGDRTSIAYRVGPYIPKYETFRGRDTMQIASRVAELIDLNRSKYKVVRAFVDVIGVGAGVYHRLLQMGYGEHVSAVNGAKSATNKEIFWNKRAEMAARFKEWLESGGAIPDNDEVHSDCVATAYEYRDHKLLLEDKEKVKKKLSGLSTDVFDSFCMTHAEPVYVPEEKKETTVDAYLRKAGKKNKRTWEAA